MRQYVYAILLCAISLTGTSQEVEDNKKDSFLQVLNQSLGNKAKMGTYIRTCNYLIDRDLKQTFELAQEGLELAQKLELPNSIMRMQNIIGNYYQRTAAYDTALIYYIRAKEIVETLDSDSGRAIVYNNIGIVHNSKGELVEALDWYLKALAAEEAIGNETGMAQAYNNIAVVYYQQQDIDKTIEYLTLAVNILERTGDEYTVKKAYNNIGALHSYQKQSEKALEFYSKSLEISKRLGDKHEMAINLSNMAAEYIQLGRFEDAKACFEQTMKIKKEENNVSGIAFEYHNYGDLYANVGDYERAEDNYAKALEWAAKAKNKRIRMMTFKSISQLYSRMNKHEEALGMLNLHMQMKDSVVNEEKGKAIAELETKYETEKKEKTILQQQNEIANSDLKLAKRKRWIQVLSMTALFIIFLGLFIVQRNKRLAQAKQDALVIAEREAGIKAIFEATENERKRIASDLHDGVGQQLSGLKLAFSKLGAEIKSETPTQEERVDRLAQVIDEACVDVRTISHEMMPKSLGEFGLVSAIDDMLQKSLKISGIAYEFEPMGVDSRFDEQTEISLYRVCQELVNNVVKHSEASQVDIQLYKAGAQLIMMVEDDGKGIPEQITSNGIGMKNMRNRISSLKGQLSIEPGPEKGTVVTVRVPVST